MPNLPPKPEADTSIRVYKTDITRLRNLVGYSDAHRVRIALDQLEQRVETPAMNGHTNPIPINSDEKEILKSFPGDTQSDKFHSFVESVWTTGLNEKLQDPRRKA